MKKLLVAAVAAAALAVAATASAALQPGVYDPNGTGCVVATYAHGVLHLEKNCPSSTPAAAGADITGLTGQTFQSASFTLASPSQCNGGSPRFDIVAGGTTYYEGLGCNNVTPTINADGSATYTFTPQTITAGGFTVPTGAISAADILIDITGTADITHITVNGIVEKPVAPKVACKHGGWKSQGYRNQGRCVSHFAHVEHRDTHHSSKKHHS
jgi:hypothetical protein